MRQALQICRLLCMCVCVCVYVCMYACLCVYACMYVGAKREGEGVFFLLRLRCFPLYSLSTTKCKLNESRLLTTKSTHIVLSGNKYGYWMMKIFVDLLPNKVLRKTCNTAIITLIKTNLNKLLEGYV